ncbi:MAG: methylmalonyl-CoA mutase family protein [Pseudomonadota bacterium]
MMTKNPGKIDAKTLEEAYWRKISRTKTWSGLETKASYRPEDISHLDYQRDVGEPGEYPFTRGIYSDMYRSKLWSMRHESGFGSPELSNQRLKFLIEQGASALDFIADQPTHQGLDGDHPLARDEVGLTGVPLTSLRDMEKLMDGIPLESASTFTNCFSSTNYIILAQYVALAERSGADIKKLRGSIIFDNIISFYCGQQLPTWSIDMRTRLGADLMEYLSKNVPYWNFLIPGYNIRETGINAIQEAAFIFSVAISYFEEMLRRGMSVDDFAPRISFIPSVHIDFFEEICKIRAERRLWAKIVKERFGGQNPRSYWFRGTAQTAGCSLYRPQPIINLARTTIESLAAVLAGVQGVQTTAYDEPICIPTDEAHRVSLRVQQILAYETGVGRVADPLGGSYYVESLTDQLEKEMVALIKKIDDMGGMFEAVKKGWVQEEIDKALIQYQREVENKERIIVGLNEFKIPYDEDEDVNILVIPTDATKRQVESVEKLKKERNNAAVGKALKSLYEAAKTDENVMPYVIDVVKEYGTVGEINGAIRLAYGDNYDPLDTIRAPFSY